MTMPAGAPDRGEARRDAAMVIAAAIVARLAVVLWAGSRIPPTADGRYYHTIASRIAQGLGYTWLWPDGVVTYAAHYPIGYPALIGALYAIFGAKPAVAMVLNAAIGVAGAGAAWALARRATTRWRALAAGLLVALHVGLVAYTPAMMTEGATASLCAVAAWCAVRASEASATKRFRWLAALGLAVGACTLLRPQSILFAPMLAWFAVAPGDGPRPRLRAVAITSAIAVLACVPWAIRNEVRMGHLALSFNGGWNLFIGANPNGGGTWAPIDVPAACKEVFKEAEKDICFGREAYKAIAEHPIAWLKLVPAKLSVTFDYCGGAGWYLHQANPAAFPWEWKVRLGAAETIFERGVLIGAIASCAIAPGPRRQARLAAGIAFAIAALTHWAWVAYLGLSVVIGLFGRALARMPMVAPATGAAILSTAAIHAVFFGSGRYSMVVFPLVTALSCGLLTGGDPAGHTAAREGDPADASH
jgi:4-amino-4-deoxy-L-arabinose transferase-like glycosyltransferase